MSDFRDALRAELVAAAARPVRAPVTTRARPVLILAAAAAAAVLAFTLPGGVGERSGGPSRDAPVTLPGRPLFSGGLKAGARYRTQHLRPAISFRASDARWMAFDTERPDFLGLGRTTGPAEPPTFRVLSFARLPRVFDPETGALEQAPADIASWIRAYPDFHVRSVRATRALGRPATQIDLTVSERPLHEDLSCWRLHRIRCALFAPNGSAWAGAAVRVLVLDGMTDPLIVAMTSRDPRELGLIAREAKPLLDSTRVAG